MENNNTNKSIVNKNEIPLEDIQTVPNTKDKEKSKNKFKNWLKKSWDLIKFAVIAFAIVIPIRMYIAQPFIVSGESMFPTFDNGQYLIVDEISYIVGHPHRNDIIIFRYPNDPSRFFIKRVIGLPNEQININRGEIKIINKAYPKGFDLPQPYLEKGYIGEKYTFSGNYKTGDKEYFVMGDNRNRSLDSHIWGNLPEKYVTGRALFRLLPFKKISYLPGDYIINK